jgi:hypothetical protein
MNEDFPMHAARSEGPPIVVLIVYFAVIGFVLASLWKVFVKAGQPGWAALVPVYNVYVMTQIAGRPAWWTALMLVPCVSVVVAFLLMIDIARGFGKSVGFGVGLALLGIVFFPMLAFGDATYKGAPQHG